LRYDSKVFVSSSCDEKRYTLQRFSCFSIRPAFFPAKLH